MNLFCKKTDPIFDALTKSLPFANGILKTPQERLQPLAILEPLGNAQAKIQGKLVDFLAEEIDLVPFIEEKTIAVLSGEKTKDVNIETGLKILSQMLLGDGDSNQKIASILEVGNTIKSSSRVSFSFDNPRIKFIDNLSLGKQLYGKSLDSNNLLLNNFTSGTILSAPPKILLVDSVYVSNNISIKFEDTSEESFEMLFDICKNLTNLSSEMSSQLKFNIQPSSKDSITFSNGTDLTFAFTCIQIDIDRINGNIFKLPVFKKKINTLFGDNESSYLKADLYTSNDLNFIELS